MTFGNMFEKDGELFVTDSNGKPVSLSSYNENLARENNAKRDKLEALKMLDKLKKLEL